MTETQADRYEPIGDPLIDEVREIRWQISKQFDHDLDRLAEHLRKVQREYKGPVVRLEDIDSHRTSA